MFSIVYDHCISCGQCVRACPTGLFYLDNADRPQVGLETGCLRCMHCVATCPSHAIGYQGMTEGQLYPERSQVPLGALVQSRRAIRHFKPDLPERTIVEQALREAAFAPSGSNLRDHHLYVLWGKQQVDRVAKIGLDYARQQTSMAKDLHALVESGRNLLTCDAPCAILCSAPDNGNRGALDSAIALTTLELLLVQAGLGTCWGGYLSRLFTASPALREWLKLEVGWQVYCALLVGYPERESYPNIPPRLPVETRWFT